jgi:DNA-binding transcriptional ArsR family regulator
MVNSLRPAPLDHRLLEEAAEMIRVLGHPVRLRIVECLEGSERIVSELVGDLKVPQAIVSQQLAKMRSAGIVACRREGNNVWYRVADDRVVRMLGCLRNCNVAGETPRS